MKGPFSEKAPPKTEGEVVTFETVLKNARTLAQIEDAWAIAQKEDRAKIVKELLISKSDVVALQTQLQTGLFQQLMSGRELVYRKTDVDAPIGHVTTDFSAVSWEHIEKVLKKVLGCVEAKGR